MIIPVIPKLPPHEPVAEPRDERVRTTTEEVLAGLIESGKLFQRLGMPFAIGPGDLRYSTATLLALEASGTVVVYDSFGKAHRFCDFDRYLQKMRSDTGIDDEGTVNNEHPDTLTWKSVGA